MSNAWKNLELRVCRALGGQRAGPQGKHGSDGTPDIPYSIECKRTVRYSLQKKWLGQARRQSNDEGKPWLLAIAEHNDRRPIVVADLWWLCGRLRRLEELERVAIDDT